MRRAKKVLQIILVLAVFTGGIWLGLKISRLTNFNYRPREENTVAVVQQIQTLSELVTVKYVVEKVVIINSPSQSTLGQLVQGENRILLLAHGIVKAGIDLKRLEPEDIQVSDKTIRIHLPPPEITDAYLDEKQTKVIDSQRGFLRNYDKDLETTARQNAVDDVSRAARADGILKEAKERAQMQLALFLSKAGFEHVEFTDKTPEPVFNFTNSVPKN
jgi:hypothetical protein